MLRTVDRVVLFAGGHVVGDQPAEKLTKDDVLRIAFSTGGPDRASAPMSRPASPQHPPGVLAS